MNKHILLSLCAVLGSLSGAAQTSNVSGLNATEFAKYWQVESESPDYKLAFIGDTAVEITSPKGLTLWRKEKMEGRVSIEYDACVVKERKSDRLSDLNCFWMASDPESPDDIMARADWRSGIFARCYSLQLYYLGYGGNYNSTTRFRRYDGNDLAVDSAALRPAILTEYTDAEHLLEPNHWYHIRITNEGGRVQYFIDGERIVDFRDAEPLTSGWFGFRTTLSRTRIANFRYSTQNSAAEEIPLQWIGDVPADSVPVSWGVPFEPGVMQPFEHLQVIDGNDERLESEAWPMAYWPDGSVKWMGMSATVPGNSERLSVLKDRTRRTHRPLIHISQDDSRIVLSTRDLTAYLRRSGECLFDSLMLNGTKVAERLRLVASAQDALASEATERIGLQHFRSSIDSATVERHGHVGAVVKFMGKHASSDGREWLPFVVRLYFNFESDEVKLVHTFIFDGNEKQDFIRSIGIRVSVPMREAFYNRHVAFACNDGGVWSEPVQPLVGRNEIRLKSENGDSPSVEIRQMAGERLPERNAFDDRSQQMLTDLAVWDGYRLSQLSPDGFTVRKRANANNPWIGTYGSRRASGCVFVGDVSGGVCAFMHDFWQSCPSTIEIGNAKTDAADLTLWLWSPEAEPMNLGHYDNVAHGLASSYEDVQEGMSTPYGIARTSTVTLLPIGGYRGKAEFARQAANLSAVRQLIPTPKYLHDVKAFGTWSLPDTSTAKRKQVEERLDSYIEIYKRAIEQGRWYGFWNYGDVMHGYDSVRHAWKYDVGGYAWDNTELASCMWLWYSFLRSGRADIWQMAVAMTRHTSEVDVYHIGDNAPLGSRHNVSHWGCGAKEARISQAAFNRFLFYLTTDERIGDLMTDVKDADQKLYSIDPMRLAQPRSLYPCTAPARLRIGPDWLAYVGNWMTEWERTQSEHYRNKITTGMQSIVGLPHQLFTGPLALGYDPATGVISSECDTSLQSTSHLMTIMGGFEVMNELMQSVSVDGWNDAWLYFAQHYKHKARELRHNRFRVARLQAYAAYHLRDSVLKAEAWHDLFHRFEHNKIPSLATEQVLPPEVPEPLDECPTVTTNEAALWSLDAIYMQEVIPLD